MTTENKRDEAIVLGALPERRIGLQVEMLVKNYAEMRSLKRIDEDTNEAIDRLKRAGKIRYNRSAKVWEKCL